MYVNTPVADIHILKGVGGVGRGVVGDIMYTHPFCLIQQPRTSLRLDS